MAASIPIAAVTIVRGAGRKLRHLNGHGVSAVSTWFGYFLFRVNTRCG